MKKLSQDLIKYKNLFLMKDKIINDEYIKSFFKQMDEMDEEKFDSVSI